MRRMGTEELVGRVKPSHSRLPRGVACDDLNESHISVVSACFASSIPDVGAIENVITAWILIVCYWHTL
jgi:hypothetical protein